ncbi:hypothetical protein [Thioalkalivibrio sp. HK1]|uniref:hypothetical protein n=1 Tax=Thioalkalivibrio sp. HK1 TaxID=1469245 RepID=UPI000471EF8B|nr:hypothetical protein [Thioalkalivibrio sp. HK1]
MFILKSFFAEPMAILRPFGNGSATGRVLALITAMAGAVLIALQPVQAQEADFYATLYEDTSDGKDKIILTFKPSLGTGRAPNAADHDETYIFTQKHNGLENILFWSGGSNLTGTNNGGLNAIQNASMTAPAGTNITSTGATVYDNRLDANVNRIVINLGDTHSFRAGDILTVLSGKRDPSNDSAIQSDKWNVQFTIGIEELNWGSDESRYTIGVPQLTTDMEYALSGVPGGTDGIGDVAYSFGSGSSITNVTHLSHVTGRNVLRVAANITIPTTPTAGCSGHHCLTKYMATDANGASIERTIIVFIVEQLHSDDVASGIPSLQQQVEGGVAVYAREMFGTDSANLVLMRGKYGSIELATDTVSETPKDATGFFILQFRKPVDTENSGQITLNLHGAAFGDVMAPSHVKVMNGISAGNNADTEIANITVQRRQGGNVGDNQVVFRITTGSSNSIKIGDYIRFEIPALMGTNLGNGEMVFISATASSVSKSGNNFFPDGPNGVSKCLSQRIDGARECIYAKAVEAVTAEVKGYDQRAKINVNDRTRAAGPESGTPNVSVTLTPDSIPQLRSRKSANVFDLGKAEISIVYATMVDVRERSHTSFPPDAKVYVPIFNASGEIFATNSVSPNDFYHLRVAPTPSHGALIAAEYEGTSHSSDLKPVQQASYQGRLQDVIDKNGVDGKKTLVKSLLYVPSGAIDSTGATPLEHGELYNMTASVDFSNASFEDKTSNPNTTAFELSSVQSKAIAYAIPPPSSADDAFIRIRCENSSGCDVSLRCSNQTGATWFGELSGRVNHNATEVLTAEEIAEILSGEGFDASRHWGGPSNGRLSCEVMTRGGSVSTQVLVRSGGILTNNTNVSMGGTPGS